MLNWKFRAGKEETERRVAIIHYFKYCLLLCVIFGLLATGCSIPEPRPVVQDSMDDEIRPKAVIQKEKQIRPPGPPPFSEKLEPVSKGLREPTRLYSLVFDQAPLSEVIRAISDDIDLSLSIESEVDLARPITVRLKNVTFEEALEMVIVKGAGYAWKIEEGCLQIKRFEERIYHLDYLDMSSSTEIEVGGDMLASSVEDSGVAGKYQIKATRAADKSDVWAGVKEALEGLKSEDGILRINPNAGIIYMADTPGRIVSMVRFLDALSESLHRQVFIEAKILEVYLSDTNQYGIDWSSFKLDFLVKSDSLKEILPDKLSLALNSGGALIMADESSFTAILDFLQTQGDVSVLSNPHLSVMNGQSALMTVGYQFPYGDIDGVDRDTDTGLITYGTSIKRAILGLQLGITPQISADGIVMLHIVPTITRIRGQEKVELPTSATTKHSISNPVIDLQELATMVRVREGESVVLAGLISRMKQLDHEGLPWVSKIPLLGTLFRHMKDSNENRELVIFITPYIKNVI